MEDNPITQHKFRADSKLTFEQVYTFAFDTYIPEFQILAKELGEEKFDAALEKIALETARRAGEEAASKLASNDFAAFLDSSAKDAYFWDHVLTVETVMQTATVSEIKVTECLWAKTFRELDAEKLGYILVCNPDFAYCQGFNLHIHLIRTKTLMQGDDYCNHHWCWRE